MRLACHFDEIMKIGKACDILADLGYKIIVNLMQISEKTSEEIKSASKYLNDNKNITCMYFADSLGSMNSNDIKKQFLLSKEFYKRNRNSHSR